VTIETTEALARALLSALSGEHSDCGGDSANCSTCVLMAVARAKLAAEAANEAQDALEDWLANEAQRSHGSLADQWDAQTGGRGR